MISFRARHRQVARQARRDQIRREVRAEVEKIARLEAGDPEALACVNADYRMLSESMSWPELVPDVEPFHSWDAVPVWDLDEARGQAAEPDPDPSWLPRPGESDRHFRRRGNPDRAKRLAALLLACWYWDADRPLPGAVRAALSAVASPRAARRMLVAAWDRAEHRVRERAPAWAALTREPAAGRADLIPRWLEVCLHIGGAPPALLACPAAGTAALGAPVIA